MAPLHMINYRCPLRELLETFCLVWLYMAAPRKPPCWKNIRFTEAGKKKSQVDQCLHDGVGVFMSFSQSRGSEFESWLRTSLSGVCLFTRYPGFLPPSTNMHVGLNGVPCLLLEVSLYTVQLHLTLIRDFGVDQQSKSLKKKKILNCQFNHKMEQYIKTTCIFTLESTTIVKMH